MDTTAPFEHRFRVALHDTDAAGVLFYGHLFRHAHDAYEAFMAARGFPLPGLLESGAVALPIVHAEADYRGPLRHGDAVTIHVSVLATGGSSFRIGYRFVGDDGTERAEAQTVHAAMDPADGRGVALPEALREALS